MSTSERSTSRGRAVHSTGRGGVGNWRSPSSDNRVAPSPGPDDYSDTRGRDLKPSRDPEMVISTGRGGSGNIRSPSRDASRGDRASIGGSPAPSDNRGRTYDRETIASIDDAHNTGLQSTGRGGIGNMTGLRPGSQSRSRSREPATNAHTSGRGGLGNMVVGGPSEKVIEELDEAERSSHTHDSGVHTVGRGGLANVALGELAHTEGLVGPHGATHPHATHTHLVESHGRGGLGNISDPLTGTVG
jgi:hypothetical protein